MSFDLVIAYVAGFILVYMTIVFIIAQLMKDNSIVDIAWGLGFIGIALFSLCVSKEIIPVKILMTTLVGIWGLRLSGYIWLRKKGEDARYKTLRKKWKNSKMQIYLKIFLAQGFFMLIISLPIIITNFYAQEKFIVFLLTESGVEQSVLLGFVKNPIILVGTIVWLIGFLFETIADYQKHKFKKTNKGLMTKGLWKYSRHPNYFGESLIWLGLWFISLYAFPGWIGILSPILITFLMIKVTGIPILEAKYKNQKEFQKYRKQTSIFIPWFPKK